MTVGRKTEAARKAARYERLAAQLENLFRKTADPIARMATAAALLEGKCGHFFWVGFYRLVDGDLVVGPYQGALACLILDRHKGVCWSGIDRGETIVVPDVHRFPGHIECDARSKSEIVVPVRDRAGRVSAVLDADSDRLDAFDETDARGLERICALIGGR